MISTVNEFLAPYGLTISTILAASGTIIASYFAAKFGASENKRQFEQQQKLEKLIAAGELLTSLYAFKRSCEDVIQDCQNDISSGGHIGKMHTSFQAVNLANGLHRPASLFGPTFVADIILLESKFFRADDSAAFLWQVENEDSASEDVVEWCAALSLDAAELMAAIAKAAGIPLIPSYTLKIEDLKDLARSRASDKDEFPAFQKV